MKKIDLHLTQGQADILETEGNNYYQPYGLIAFPTVRNKKMNVYALKYSEFTAVSKFLKKFMKKGAK